MFICFSFGVGRGLGRHHLVRSCIFLNQFLIQWMLIQHLILQLANQKLQPGAWWWWWWWWWWWCRRIRSSLWERMSRHSQRLGFWSNRSLLDGLGILMYHQIWLWFWMCTLILLVVSEVLFLLVIIHKMNACLYVRVVWCAVFQCSWSGHENAFYRVFGVYSVIGMLLDGGHLGISKVVEIYAVENII